MFHHRRGFADRVVVVIAIIAILIQSVITRSAKVRGCRWMSCSNNSSRSGWPFNYESSYGKLPALPNCLPPIWT